MASFANVPEWPPVHADGPDLKLRLHFGQFIFEQCVRRVMIALRLIQRLVMLPDLVPERLDRLQLRHIVHPIHIPYIIGRRDIVLLLQLSHCDRVCDLAVDVVEQDATLFVRPP